jgi:23S rRNA pseudouridine1911/1915/1917 synthase
MPKPLHSMSSIIPDAYINLRLDQALAKLFPDYSRSYLSALIRAGDVSVDNKQIRQSDKVSAGQVIEIAGALPLESEQDSDTLRLRHLPLRGRKLELGLLEAQQIPLDIIYEDASLLIVNKPAGLIVHPGAGNPNNTLFNALLGYAPELAALPRAGIVHRLDKDTTGLLVVARTLPAHTYLVRELQARTIKREYEAIVSGVFISGATIDAPITRHPRQRTRMHVNLISGRPATTHYRIIERFQYHTLIKVILETGRTHQIRVHTAYVHHPVLGDPQYGGRLQLQSNLNDELKDFLRHFKRQALHARRLALKHPESGELVTWEAPRPQDLEDLLKLLRESALQK